MTEDDDLAAGEYVLGTLDAEERRAFFVRLVRDPEAVAAVAAWQARLAPLGLATVEQAVPADLWQRIERNLFGSSGAANDNKRMERGWRAAAIAASLIACGTGFLAWQTNRLPVTTAPTAMAALTSAGEAPGLVITYDEVRQRVRILPAAIRAPHDRSFELWLIAGSSDPKSMGLLPAHGDVALAGMQIDPATASFAVSVEPVGGSPTGAPTGQVIYSGKMIRVAPEV